MQQLLGGRAGGRCVDRAEPEGNGNAKGTNKQEAKQLGSTSSNGLIRLYIGISAMQKRQNRFN